MSPEEIIQRLDKVAQVTILKQVMESREFKKKTEQFAFDMLMEMLEIKLNNQQIGELIKSLYALHGLDFY
jgi:hypothetical protein